MTKKPDILPDTESKSKASEKSVGQVTGLALDTARHALHGCVDVILNNTVFGTAWDANDQSAKADVEIYDTDTFLDRVTADSYRRDLELLGIGDGRHGFEYELPPAVDPKDIRIVFSGTNAALKHGPFFGSTSSAEKPAENGVNENIDELKSILATLERKIDSTLPTLGGLEAQVGAFSDRTKVMAVKQDLGKLHESLMKPLTGTQEKINEIAEAGTRIEGFLNIELSKRIAKEFDVDGLNERLRELETRLRRATYGRLGLLLLVLALGAAFISTLPSGWFEELRQTLPWLFRQ